MSRKSASPIDRKAWPHVYVGTPSAIHLRRGGRLLVKGEACRIYGRRAGGLRIRTADGREWIVGPRDAVKHGA